MTHSLLLNRIPLFAMLATGLFVAVAAIASAGAPAVSFDTPARAEASFVAPAVQEATSSTADVAFAGDFVRKDGPISITGEVVVITDGTGGHTLRLTENFKVDRGRDQVVVLRSAEAETLTLGALQSAGGQQDYALPENVDFDVWDEVLIWDAELSFAYGTAFLEAAE